MQRGIALFGGVFDPPHRGHLALARLALTALPIDRVRLVIAGRPPHKNVGERTSGEHRLAMLRLAIGDDRDLEIDTRELSRSGPSYTVQTLREVRAEEPRRELFFLIGGDNIRSIRQWYQAEEIFSLARVVAFPRPGSTLRFRPEDVPFLDETALDRLNRDLVPGPETPGSSSEVRRRVANGEPIRDLVPDAVANYIEHHGLYLSPC
ncbi:MAG: nicotinate (nicotinamide) nucleotide adenylyltransferase [Planctomycetes bacterium]|nr:nicotinate (nicotinamide) nucleotide adenylyltransferase [Planctomycetota bacterium]